MMKKRETRIQAREKRGWAARAGIKCMLAHNGSAARQQIDDAHHVIPFFCWTGGLPMLHASPAIALH